MAEDVPFVGDPADSREAIMCATHRALREHGYAGLSIQRIADESDLSKSTFYHHYDDKEDLIASFVEFMLEAFVHVFSLEAGDDPRENLRTFVDLLFLAEAEVDRDIPAEVETILESYVELRAQAVRDETVRRKFTEADEAFADHIRGIVRAGIEDDVFSPVDPEATAEFIATVLAGNVFRRTTGDAHETDPVRAELDEYVERRLLP